MIRVNHHGSRLSFRREMEYNAVFGYCSQTTYAGHRYMIHKAVKSIRWNFAANGKLYTKMMRERVTDVNRTYATVQARRHQSA